jgi:hypothetical protein
MRDYAKVSPKFWTGDTGQELARRGSEALVVGLYLMTSPHSNMLGLFYQPVLYIAEETGLTPEAAQKGLVDCMEAGFCDFDPISKMVWVFEMAGYQIDSELKATDLRVKGIRKDYAALPNNPFLAPFFERYAGAFHLDVRREFVPKGKGAQLSLVSPFKAPSKPGTGTGTGTGAGTREGTGTGKPSASSPAKLPTPPTKEIIDLYHEVLPDLPAVRLHTKDRVRALGKLWTWVLTSTKGDHTRRATDRDEALAWIRSYFERAKDNDFLMGRTPRTGEHANWKCDLDFLLTDKGMKHVIEKTQVTE